MKRKEENRQWAVTARDQIHTKKQQQSPAPVAGKTHLRKGIHDS
jgi:hypothetical protein